MASPLLYVGVSPYRRRASRIQSHEDDHVLRAYLTKVSPARATSGGIERVRCDRATSFVCSCWLYLILLVAAIFCTEMVQDSGLRFFCERECTVSVCRIHWINVQRSSSAALLSTRSRHFNACPDTCGRSCLTPDISRGSRSPFTAAVSPFLGDIGGIPVE